MSDPDAAAEPAARSGTGEAAGGLVRATMSATGEVLQLDIEPKAMRLPSDELAAALRSAMTSAHADARAVAPGSAQPGSAQPGSAQSGAGPDGAPEELRAELERIGGEAQQRIAALANLARDLSARLDRM